MPLSIKGPSTIQVKGLSYLTLGKVSYGLPLILGLTPSSYYLILWEAWEGACLPLYIVHIMYGSNAPYDVSLMYYGMVKPLPIMGKGSDEPTNARAINGCTQHNRITILKALHMTLHSTILALAAVFLNGKKTLIFKFSISYFFGNTKNWLPF